MVLRFGLRIGREALPMKRKKQEHVIQRFPHRCPYCDQSISYDQYDLREGDNEIHCPSCKKTYIKVVSNATEEAEAEGSRSVLAPYQHGSGTCRQAGARQKGGRKELSLRSSEEEGNKASE